MYGGGIITVVVLWLCLAAGLVLCTNVDLTLVPEENGANVVLACIAKIDVSRIFPRDDQQLIRRIAYTETENGLDPSTYSGSSNNGGIWQLSEDRYIQTKDNTDSSVLQKIQEMFDIDWASTSWVDLRKPFFSALAARLYIELEVASVDSFPFSTNIPLQSSFWINVYTSSSKTEADYAAVAILLNEQERENDNYLQ